MRGPGVTQILTFAIGNLVIEQLSALIHNYGDVKKHAAVMPAKVVTPAQAGAGIQKQGKALDSRVRGNDTKAVSLPSCPRRRTSRREGRCWIPAFTGMTSWIPAFAGMTTLRGGDDLRRHDGSMLFYVTVVINQST